MPPLKALSKAVFISVKGVLRMKANEMFNKNTILKRRNCIDKN